MGRACIRACLKEISYQNVYISKEDVLELAKPVSKNDYGQYLEDLVRRED